MMTDEYLNSVIGGAASNVNASLLNSIARVLGIVIEAGRAVGSAIRYAISKKHC